MQKVFASLAILASGLSAASLNSTEIDSMVRNSCNGDKMCMNLMAELDLLDLERSTTDRASFLRRLKQLKALILHLQPAHHFARYCFYGCWCLPDAEHTVEGVGFGAPIDEVDGSCKRQASCYECAKMDHEGRNCVADQVQYNYKLNVGADHNGNSIECLDEPNSEKFSCRRSICECDKKIGWRFERTLSRLDPRKPPNARYVWSTKPMLEITRPRYGRWRNAKMLWSLPQPISL